MAGITILAAIVARQARFSEGGADSVLSQQICIGASRVKNNWAG
jgi:hypothetical protein